MVSDSHSNMLNMLCVGTTIRVNKKRPAPTSDIPINDSKKVKESVPDENEKTDKSVRKKHRIVVKGFDVTKPCESFQQMKELHPKILKYLLKKLPDNNIDAPTPIQMQCIPLLMDKRSILSCSPTGSGKTLTFVIPILSHLKKSQKGGFRALILSPTRELAQQIYREFKIIGGSRKFSVHFLSKDKAKSDVLTNEDGNKDVLIATPSYLLSMLENKKLDLSNLEFCMLDEADRLFEDGKKGFREEVFKILEYVDLIKVTVGLFSATLANGVDNWCFQHLDNFIQVFIGQVNGANSDIKQSLKFVGTEESKIYTLKSLLQQGFKPPTLIFTQTKERAKQLHQELKLVNSKTECIHSDLAQHKREEVIQQFREGKVWILICTDLLSRGLDFKHVNCVINFDLPQTKVDYIHRIGRTGRAGRSGEAITFFTEEDKKILPNIINVLKNSGCELPPWLKNLKGIARRDLKKACKKPVVRNSISTLPKYDQEKAAKRKQMIKASKEKKMKASESS